MQREFSPILGDAPGTVILYKDGKPQEVQGFIKPSDCKDYICEQHEQIQKMIHTLSADIPLKEILRVEDPVISTRWNELKENTNQLVGKLKTQNKKNTSFTVEEIEQRINYINSQSFKDRQEVISNWEHLKNNLDQKPLFNVASYLTPEEIQTQDKHLEKQHGFIKEHMKGTRLIVFLNECDKNLYAMGQDVAGVPLLTQTRKMHEANNYAHGLDLSSYEAPIAINKEALSLKQFHDELKKLPIETDVANKVWELVSGNNSSPIQNIGDDNKAALTLLMHSPGIAGTTMMRHLNVTTMEQLPPAFAEAKAVMISTALRWSDRTVESPAIGYR